MLGKDDQDTERASNRLLNGEALPGRVPGPERDRSRKSAPDPVGVRLDGREFG